ncbi:multiple epidermal growth factor-like domains protein 10 [Macrosteles quadrilineatus]|uniref:multiple epidermal growth factor-like domains protein 10 n=1 Tax=Macrosteles quadrilineatus TaxID=74068 RepID=UPI0023E2F4DE|nr:multiple epidermal growth factor-like domains protein 10 [Macrosteles quadrilineatus]
MGATSIGWLSVRGIISIFLYFLLTKDVSGETNGICTRTEVVSKSKLRRILKTYEETYWDWCRSQHYYSSHQCVKTRTNGGFALEKESYTELETKHFCCPGYSIEQESPLRCAPVCEFTCLNGKCTRPNYCECDSGYKKNNNTENICEPVCSEECSNGYCSSPEHCKCDLGYDHIPSVSMSKFVCSPVCSNSCINANCVAPDVCLCLPGFAKTLVDPSKCHPVCNPSCKNGVCSAVDECICFEGYSQSVPWYDCNPVCTECVNGICTAPEQCSCLNGFRKVANVCEPICSNGCSNGDCVLPDTCSCLPGYKNSSDPFSCIPICFPECVNGNCINPDQCECFPGFEENDKNVCQPYCNSCENGLCSEPEVCSCFWGFENENISSCSRQNIKQIDCTFSSIISNYKFDKSCFTLTTRFSMKIANCEILQYLKVLYENETVLELFCKEVSNIELVNNILYLSLECMLGLQNIEETYTEEISTSYESSSTSSTLTNYSDTESTIDYSSWSSEHTWPTSERSTEFSDLDYTSENIESEPEFHIKYDTIMSNATKFTDLLLDVNITLKFLPLIAKSRIMEHQFDNIAVSEKDWCLCHRNEGNWSICVSSPVQLYMCPCPPTFSGLSVESEGSTLIGVLKNLILLVIFLMAALAVVYILQKNKDQSGSYSTYGPARKTDESSSTPLPIDLVVLDGIPEDNTQQLCEE